MKAFAVGPQATTAAFDESGDPAKSHGKTVDHRNLDVVRAAGHEDMFERAPEIERWMALNP